MLLAERQTQNSIAFQVNLREGTDKDSQASPANAPEIKKRLEMEATKKATTGPSITLEQIAEKLKRAEEKRRESITIHLGNQTQREQRRNAAIDQRRSIERVQADQLKEKLHKDLNKAVEKRLTEREMRMQKLRCHISKVQEVCKEQAVRR